MITGKILNDFCDLVLKIGVNLQKGQGLEIICPIEKSEVAEKMTERAYLLGAKIVRIRWENEIIDRLTYENASIESLSEIPKWQIDSKNYLAENNYCYVAIAAENPSAFKGVAPEKLNAAARAKGKAYKKFSDCVMNNGIRWCVVSVPTKEWAKQVFNSKNAEELLSENIEKSMRLDCENPIKAWENHVKTLDKRAEFLNKKNFVYLQYKNSLGTDFIVGLADGHKWLSAKEKAKDGIDFIANMPTEEVFTAPHLKRAEGVVYSALPLSYNGNLIENFSLTFKRGKVVSFYRAEGIRYLKGNIRNGQGNDKARRSRFNRQKLPHSTKRSAFL